MAAGVSPSHPACCRQVAIAARRPVLLRSAADDAQFASAESVVSLSLKSAVACPVEIAGRLIGVFYVGTTRLGEGFDEGDRDTLSLFATLAGSLLQNAAFIEQQGVLLHAAHAQSPISGDSRRFSVAPSTHPARTTTRTRLCPA